MLLEIFVKGIIEEIKLIMVDVQTIKYGMEKDVYAPQAKLDMEHAELALLVLYQIV